MNVGVPHKELMTAMGTKGECPVMARNRGRRPSAVATETGAPRSSASSYTWLNAALSEVVSRISGGGCPAPHVVELARRTHTNGGLGFVGSSSLTLAFDFTSLIPRPADGIADVDTAFGAPPSAPAGLRVFTEMCVALLPALYCLSAASLSGSDADVLRTSCGRLSPARKFLRWMTCPSPQGLVLSVEGDDP